MKSMGQYDRTSFEQLRSLAQEDPEIYGDKFWQCKRALWRKGLLNEVDFPFVRLRVEYSRKGMLYFTNASDHKSYRFVIWFMDNQYLSDKVFDLMICEYTLRDMQENSFPVCRGRITCNILQLCEPGLIGTREDPTPDEFVYVSFRTEDRTIEEDVKFQICYG